MNKRISLLTSSVVAIALLSGGCGGGSDDADARRGRIQAGSEDGKDKSDKAPPGQEAPRVGKQDSSQCGTAFEANWVESPKSVKEAAGKANNIVEAEVVDVQPGQDIVIPASAEPDGEYRIPRQDVTIKVLRTHKGGASQDENITLTQTGSQCRELEGDPKYTKGEKHLLLLTDAGGGKQRTISPEGRYKVKDDGTLEPPEHSATAKEVKGKKVKDIEDKLK